ncbi:hypothetical protein [Marisediminicola sp. LYQ85]|uniref:hypothetical protein n=1 Tax=Marisediminicola sp. LYQ85 TaxID=3391062 RepID=UPI003983C3F3
MSKISKLARLAQKALDKSGSGSKTSGSGQNDWRAVVRSAADALTGDGRAEPQGRPNSAPVRPERAQPAANLTDADRAAIARYDYLLETADPRQIEQVHREAFEGLTPAQRQEIQERMNAELPPHERPTSAETGDLARAAARTEAGRPGSLRGLLARVGGGGTRSGSGGGGAGRGMMVGGAVAGAGLAAGGVLGAVAGGAILSSVAGPLLDQAASLGVDFDALASGIDVEGLTGGVDDLASGAGGAVSGLGDQVGEFGSGFELPGLDDFFGR